MNIIPIIISGISVVFSVFFGFFSLSYNAKNSKHTDTKEIEDRVKENTKINMKLDAILDTINEMKNERSEMKKELDSHDIRITVVEESVKQAHHRINEIAERINCKGAS